MSTLSLIEPPALEYALEPAPNIATNTTLTDAPWLYSALTELRELEHSGRLFRGLGDLRLTGHAVMQARLMLSSVEIENLPAPLVSPVPGGGLSVTWSVGPREIKYSFDPGGQAFFFKIEDDEMTGEGAIQNFASNEVTRQLQWMLNGQA